MLNIKRIFEDPKLSLWLSALIFIICAIFSEGFWHPDEHYQILELVNLKRPNAYHDMSIFNWDFSDKIRSWFQPFLYYYLFYPIKFLDPFKQALIIRLFNGLLFWFALKSLYGLSFFNYQRKLLLTSLIWFVPFIMVRTSSESLSISLFIFATVLFLKNYSMLPIGFIFGLSFLARYQMGIPIFFVGMLYLFKEKDLKSFSLFVLGILFSFGVGALVDFWGYGQWNFSAYNYFYTNLIESRASAFGVEPFWYYFYKPLIKGVPPISFVLFFSFVYYIYYKRINYISIALMSFILIHSFIPHKEVRFLSFVYVLTPFLYFKIEERLQSGKLQKIFLISLLLNIPVTFKTIFTAIQGEMVLYKEVYDLDIKKLYTSSRDDNFKFTMPFYQKSKIVTLIDPDARGIHLTTKFSTYKQYQTKCANTFLSYPKEILRYNYFKWLDRSSVMALWKCE